jgi:NAD(P)H-dependent FMN reductase
MYKIAIISSSIRSGKKSDTVALYLQNYIRENALANVEIIDLKQLDFPLFTEQIKHQKKPSLLALEFKNKIISTDAIIIVTPEYNGSIPASLKNVIDLLHEEWFNKTIAFSTVSSNEFGGLEALTHLEFIFKKIGAMVNPTNFSVPKVHENFDDFGNPTDKIKTDQQAKIFIEELLRYIKVNKC